MEITLYRASKNLSAEQRLVFTFLMNNLSHTDIGKILREQRGRKSKTPLRDHNADKTAGSRAVKKMAEQIQEHFFPPKAIRPKIVFPNAPPRGKARKRRPK